MGKKVLIDLTGRRFGMLTVLRRGEDRVYANGQHHPTWICKCDCGAVVERVGDGLRDGQTVSCGCVPKMTKSRGFVLPKPITIQDNMMVGRFYKIDGRKRKCIGMYDNYARFEDSFGFHECFSYWELERKL